MPYTGTQQEDNSRIWLKEPTALAPPSDIFKLLILHCYELINYPASMREK